jgi:acyl-coenzyme A synthetase/AMP-(fatty) acid ligase
VGVSDRIYGEEVVSFVVKKEGSQACAGDLISYCTKTLPDFKIPKKIIFVQALPRNQRGKVAKNALLKLLEQET